jgi:hypothetical protein
MRTSLTLEKCKLFADILVYQEMNTKVTGETIDDTLVKARINKFELPLLIKHMNGLIQLSEVITIMFETILMTVFLLMFNEFRNTLKYQSSDITIYVQIALYIFLYDPLCIHSIRYFLNKYKEVTTMLQQKARAVSSNNRCNFQ